MDTDVGLQRARLMAVLRGMSAGHGEDESDALLLIGLAVGLVLAVRHPETAARMLVELQPPIDTINRWLDWVVFGAEKHDPDLPLN